MGGVGSGTRRTLTDEQKAERGTLFKGTHAAEIDEAARDRILPGPWLDAIPPPQMPMGDIARKKYDELCRLLFDQGKLNTSARDVVEICAMQWQGFHNAATKGKVPSTYSLKEYNRSIALLNLAQNAPPLAGRDRPRKFAIHGFADKVPPKAG